MCIRDRNQPDGVADREALHVVAGARPPQQDFGRQGAVIEDATHQQSGRVVVTTRRRVGRADRYRAGCLLSPPGGSRGKGEGDHRHRPQDRRSVLQHATTRYVVRRSRRDVLRRTLQATCPRQSPTAREVAGIRFASGGAGPRADGGFLGNFGTSLKQALHATWAGMPVELWFQDEARVGQKGSLSYIWSAV